MDYAHEQTNRALEELEQRIREIYSEAAAELRAKIDAYFKHFKLRDEQQRALMEAGEITKEQYQLWRLAQIGRGERLEALQEELARRNNEANQVAAAYINDTTPGIYSLNHNYTAYTIEQAHGNVGFTLYDEQTVRRLLAEEPELFPAPSIDIPFDLRWNKAELRRQLVSGIILGESIGKLADRFQRVTDMNRTSALRNARTAMTGAQNAGRQESMLRAKEMGIKQRKRWIATKDLRTRHSHGMLDGQTVEVDECFVSVSGNRMMYPCDSSHGADPSDIYNCRCTMRTVEKEGIEAEPRQMRVRNPVTGRNELVSEMTYSEWFEWKKTLENDMEDVIIESLGNNRPRNKSLEKAIRRSIKEARPVFCEGALAVNSKRIKPVDGYYDAVLHGCPTSGELFGETISAQILANVLRARSDYENQSIRLLSCNTGAYDENGNCFAQELADIMGVIVQAPDKKLWVYPNGVYTIGKTSRSYDGRMVLFFPRGGEKSGVDQG